ncbi:MAG: glycosyltransferase [Blastocatellia bacterium]|nr:glycosyltransferase [Blastocatellia bacterium]
MAETAAIQLGVSLVICTYNGARRLPETLRRLGLQHSTDGLRWEVIVVNNASTDETESVANSWRPPEGVHFAVVHEPKPGLSHARNRGIAEARYEVVSFIDDDNRISANWVQAVSALMLIHPRVGACGGMCEAVFESDPPEWFEEYRGNYVIGGQGAAAGDVTDERGWLWGAGLTIRKSVWLALQAAGFAPMLRDREGDKLSSCGDIEFCYAIRLAGYRLWYEPALKIDHFIPANRLHWPYVLSLYEGVGAATVKLDWYESLLASQGRGLRNRLRRTWQYQAAASLKQWLEAVRDRAVAAPDSAAARKSACSARFFSSRFRALLRLRSGYDAGFEAMASAGWLRERIS